MGLSEKIKDTAGTAKGKFKEVVGKITGNRRLQSDGQADQAKVKMKQGARKIKDAIEDALD